jgi:hypothetical protein
MNWDSLRPQFPGADSWPIEDLNDLTLVWVAGTILVALIALGWAGYKTVVALQRIEKYSRLLEGFRSADDFAENRKTWSEAKRLPLTASFDEMLVEVPRKNAALERELRRCGSAADVFNPTSLAPGLVGSRMLLAIPAILTGLGVLGTFVGLQLGIKELDLTFASQPPSGQVEQTSSPSVAPPNDAANRASAATSGTPAAGDEGVQKMMRSVSELVAGCSTAFATSVWGVLCSLIFTIVEKLLESVCVQRIRRLQHRLDTLIARYNPEDSMIELHRSAGQQEYILKGLAVAIGEQMQTAMDRLGSSIANGVKNALGSQDTVDLLSKELAAELKNLQEAIVGMSNGFKAEFLDASSKLNSTVAGFDTVLQKVDSSVQSSQVAVDQAVERLTDHAEVSRQLKEGSTRLKEAAEELTSLRDTFTLSAQRNAEAAAAQEKAAATNDAVATRFEIIGDKLPDVQTAISKGASVIESLGKPLLDLKEILAGTPALFERQAEEQAVRDESRSSMLLNQTGTLTNAVAAAAEKLSRVESLAGSLQTSTGNLNDASQALGLLAESIHRASEQQAQAASFSEKSALAGASAAEKLAPIPASLETLNATLTNAANGLNAEFGKASETIGVTIAGFKTVLEGVDSTVQSSRNAMNQAVERLTTHEQVVQQLREGSIRLQDAARELSSLRDTFTLSAQRNAEAAAAQEKAAASNTAVATRFEVIGDKLPEVQTAIAEGASVIESIGKPLLDVARILNDTPAIFGKQAEEQAKRDDYRTSTLLNQTETLANAVADAAEKFSQVESLAGSLQSSAGNLNDASQALGDLAEAIQRASEQHAKAASSSEKSALAGSNAAEKLAPIPASLEALSTTLTHAGGRIKEGAEAARDVYGQLLQHQREWFGGIESGLLAMKDQVQSILDSYGLKVEDETKRQMKQWIDAVDDSLRRFSAQIQALEGLVSDLSSTDNH